MQIITSPVDPTKWVVRGTVVLFGHEIETDLYVGDLLGAIRYVSS